MAKHIDDVEATSLGGLAAAPESLEGSW